METKEIIVLLIDEPYCWGKQTLYRVFLENIYGSQWGDFFQENLRVIENISESISENVNMGKIVYPPIESVFRCFIPIPKIKVAILGQDPYHNGSATGFCFDVKQGNLINPSLSNIYQELERDGFKPKKDGNLLRWANQGCFLMNTALTVEKGKPESHLDYWKTFSEKVIGYLSSIKPLAWIIFGAKALSFTKFIKKGELFISSHPSPFSAHKSFRNYPSFLGSSVFSRVNRYIEKNGDDPIVW